MKDIPLSDITKRNKNYNILFNPAIAVTACAFFRLRLSYKKCLLSAPSAFMTSVLMLSAGDSGIVQIACQPTFGNIFYITGTTPQNLDALAVQDIYCPLSHIPCQQEFHAHFCKCLGDIRFAAATGGRCDLFLREDLVFVINSEHRETFTVSKVFINLILA
jgi:hypothetical protein